MCFLKNKLHFLHEIFNYFKQDNPETKTNILAEIQYLLRSHFSAWHWFAT